MTLSIAKTLTIRYLACSLTALSKLEETWLKQRR